MIPAVTRTLASTGEFAHHSMKRYDDTMPFPFDAHRHGLETGRGGDTIRKLNRIHGHYDISNTDYLHILAGHLVSAIDWINAYGWRHLTEGEQRALVLTHRRLGTLMGIKDIPESYEQFKSWLDDDTKQRGTWHYANGAMVGYVLGIIADLCPRGTKTIAKRAIVSLLDEPIRTMLDQPKPRPLGSAAPCAGACAPVAACCASHPPAGTPTRAHPCRIPADGVWSSSVQST